ncbi:MAG: hypothetical protein OXC94_05050 [Chloroflexi bacterium]|nr:hypothetical protein [Chloroflexota bacterium]
MYTAALQARSPVGHRPSEVLRAAGAAPTPVLAPVLVVVVAVAARAATLPAALPGPGPVEFIPLPPSVPTASAGAAS